MSDARECKEIVGTFGYCGELYIVKLVRATGIVYFRGAFCVSFTLSLISVL